jgi:hypothetical protein
MSSFRQFDAFAAARGEGLHPKLRSLLERTASTSQTELTPRLDGMSQAGQDPQPESTMQDYIALGAFKKVGKITR